MSYPEPLQRLIRAAQVREDPDQILEVARALEREGFPEDALEWRRWYVHLRPAQAARVDYRR